MEFCLGLRLRSPAGQCLDRDWWNFAALLALNSAGGKEPWWSWVPLTPGAQPWNRGLTEMCWTRKMCEGLCVAFHHLFNLKEDYFKGLIIELRNVSREQKTKKKIDLCYRQSHALQFTLRGDAVSPWGKSCQKCWKWSACFLLKLTCREALVFRDC